VPLKKELAKTAQTNATTKIKETFFMIFGLSMKFPFFFRNLPVKTSTYLPGKAKYLN
jgi:hypothetical protein